MRILPLLFVIFTLPQLCAAQSLGGGAVNPLPTLDLEPAYPSPQDTVKVIFNDYRSNTVGSEVRWFYNNNLIPEATDRREVEVTAPAAGSVAEVKMVITKNGNVETHSATIRPVYLDIIIEPQTHIPEFYTGRALPSIGSQINVIALLNDGKALSNDYVYTWRVNDKVLQGGGLRGQSTVNFIMPQGSNTILSLQVATYAGEVIAKRTLLVPSVKPEIHFYETNPLYGVETKAIKDSFNLIGNSSIIRTEPFYLDSTVFNYSDILEWTIDGKKVTPDSNNPYEVTLERTGYPGNARLGFHVRSTTQLLQGAKADIGINI
jgi:hypothetical protein